MGLAESLGELIGDALEAQSAATRVALPGRIESFDATTQKANIKPLLWESYETPEGELAAGPLPVVPSVPVVFMAGHTSPVSVGDTCLLIFADRSLDVWLHVGGDVDPLDVRRHSLTDAVAIMGLRPFASPLSAFDASRVRLGGVGHPGAAVSAAGVELGVTEANNATEAAILGNSYHTLESTFLTALNTASSAIGTAANAAGVALNVAGADPTLAGLASVAAASLATAGAALQQIQTATTTLNTAITTFQTALPTSRSALVKLK